ncbi:MAG: magnesium transporter [Ruminococcus sp.]|nr:magnesium transporter [Ruminococcus sp.]
MERNELKEQELLDQALSFIENKQYTLLKNYLADQNPADIAAIMEEVEDKDIPIIFRILPKDEAAETFSYMESETQRKLIVAFSDKELREVLDDLYLDDTVDMIEEMPANVVAKILRNTDIQTRKNINELLKYPDDSAGSLMTIEYVYFNRDMTISEALDRIRSVGVVKETIYTCYVTQNRKLVGVVSVLQLLTADPQTKIEEIMDSNVIYVHTDDDQEYVAKQIQKYDFLALPVVDKEDRLVGIITVDDVIDVIHEELTEDVSKMAGITPNENSYFNTSVFQHAKSRIGWLLFLMLSATLTGMVINHYEHLLVTVPLLYSFVPMLTGTGGNSGSQAATLIIRGLSMDEIQLKDIFKVMFKEFRIALLVSSVLAVVNGARIAIVYWNNDQGVNSILLGLAIAISIVFVIVLAKTVGCVLPMIAKKIHLDPAIMAAPLISTIVDACAVLIYCNVCIIMFDNLL